MNITNLSAIALAQNSCLTKATRKFLDTVFEEGTAKNTKKAYKSDLSYFRTWMKVSGLGELTIPVGVDVILRFISDHLGSIEDPLDERLVNLGAKARLGVHSLNTIKRRLSSLAVAHKIKGVESPTSSSQVKETLKKAGKALSAKGLVPKKKKAITKNILDSMIKTCGADSITGTRDAAMLLFMAASGGRRRSETSMAKIEDLTEVEDGFLFYLKHSKTDQEGKGSYKPVLGKAGRALQNWLDAASITAGPLFRPITRWGKIQETSITGASIRRVVIKRAYLVGKAEGMSEYQADKFASQFGAHSLRSGFVTQWGRVGGSRVEGMELTGHKSATVFDGYYQAGNVLNNAAARIFD